MNNYPNNNSNSPTAIWVAKHGENNPLIEVNPPNLPPLAGPEIDDIDDGDTQVAKDPYPGIDDGFFDNEKPPFIPDLSSRIGPDDEPDSVIPPSTKDSVPINIPNNVPSNVPSNVPNSISNNYPNIYPSSNYPASIPERPFPNAPGYRPYDHRTNDFEFSAIPDLESIPDVNVYQHKKTLAQGMMDLALFSANANQLRYILESFDRHPYFYPSVFMISMSLLLQVGIGVGLIWNARYNVKDKKEICVANRINNYTVIGIFLVTTINVFISAFGVANAPTPITIGPRFGEGTETVEGIEGIEGIEGGEI